MSCPTFRIFSSNNSRASFCLISSFVELATSIYTVPAKNFWHGCSFFADKGDQIGEILRREDFFETFGHERNPGAGELIQVAAQDGFLAVGGAKGDAVGGLGREDAAEFTVTFGNGTPKKMASANLRGYGGLSPASRLDRTKLVNFETA